MSRLKWDQVGERLYKTGVDRCVVYPMTNGEYPKGVAWNGITAINESPSGAESNKQYADNMAYLNLISAEEFAATIEAFFYPDEFAECDGSAEAVTGVTIKQQTRKPFGLCYRTLLGNDTDGTDYGYEIHCIYNGMAAPSEASNSSVNDSPEAAAMSWEVSTTPVEVTDYKPTAHLVINSTKVDASALKAFEDIIYGKDAEGDNQAVEPKLPLPDAIIAQFTVVEETNNTQQGNESST